MGVSFVRRLRMSPMLTWWRGYSLIEREKLRCKSIVFNYYYCLFICIYYEGG